MLAGEKSYLDIIDQLQPELLQALRRLVAIESVRGEASEEAPYGPGPKKALDLALEMAGELGFETVNLDNKIGYAVWGDPKETPYVGVFGHVDVVPLGEGWRHEPLGCEVEDGRVYGRGVLDNKGPILANLFAAYALKKAGFQPKLPLRIVFGCNEETGFGCVRHYVEKEAPPLCGWTPDCKWPVVYGERGRLVLSLRADEEQVDSLYRFVNDFILSSTADGRKLGLNVADEDFGLLSMGGYRLEKEGKKHGFSLSLSYPAAITKEGILERIEAKLPEGLELHIEKHWAPVLLDKEAPFISLLQGAYNDVTGKEARPVTTTGGTYAKIVPHIVAFGPSFPGQRDIAHLPDEWMDLDDLRQNSRIYTLALARLLQEEAEDLVESKREEKVDGP